MYEYILILALHATAGIGREPLIVSNPKPYMTLDRCVNSAKESAEYLAQDFMTVEWWCKPVPRKS